MGPKKKKFVSPLDPGPPRPRLRPVWQSGAPSAKSPIDRLFTRAVAPTDRSVPPWIRGSHPVVRGGHRTHSVNPQPRRKKELDS